MNFDKILIHRLQFALWGEFLSLTIQAQDSPLYPGLEDPSNQGINKEWPRASFMSYESKELAMKGSPEASGRFASLNGTKPECRRIGLQLHHCSFWFIETA